MKTVNQWSQRGIIIDREIEIDRSIKDGVDLVLYCNKKLWFTLEYIKNHFWTKRGKYRTMV